MIGDSIIISKLDKQRAKVLLPIILKLKEHSIVCIQGGSGTHKSELMMCLQEYLYKNRKNSLGISLDDYYIIPPLDRNRVRKRNGIKSVGLAEIDWKYVKQILKGFKLGFDRLNIQYINKYTDSTLDVVVYNVQKINYIIVEGLYAGYLKKYNLCDYCIHLLGSPVQTEKFRKLRKKEQESGEFRRKIVQKEYKVVSQLKKYADKIFYFGK